MNRGNVNPFLYAMRFRGLKHGSEEEYDMFEEFAICRARNRRMNGAADSRLQLENSGADGDARGALAQHARDADEQLAMEDSSSCTEDGKRCGEKDASPVQTAATHGTVRESSTPRGDDQVCRQGEESVLPDSSTSSSSSNSADHDPSEECSKVEELWRTCCLQ